ncbi:MAG: hypothetical protein U0Y10_13430 [Spirosomataceae bacterium]
MSDLTQFISLFFYYNCEKVGYLLDKSKILYTLMSELTQAEFDFLMKLEKEFEDKSTILLYPAPMQWTRKIKSTSSKDFFCLDFYRGTFKVQKYTYNHRYKQTLAIFRFDSYGIHTNPDGQKIEGFHIHVYKEGFGDKFAYPASEFGIKESDTMEIILEKFLLYCNIKPIGIEPPML